MKRIFIAWGRETELSKYLAKALEADFKQIYVKKIAGIRLPALIQYIIQGIWTVIILLLYRPKVVIVQNPPIFAPFLILIYTKIFRAKLMIDTHTAGFLDKKWINFYPLFKFTARRAHLNTCHNYKNLEILNSWGVKPAMVLQFFNPQYNAEKINKPLINQDLEEKIKKSNLPIMMVNRFANDDDWETVIRTAHFIPEATFFITGQPSNKIKKIIKKENLNNIFLTGYLKHNEFIKLMNKCAIVLAFTLRPDTVLWSIREILALKKPFITTNNEVLRHYFGEVGLFVDPRKPEELKKRIIFAIENEKELREKQKEFLKKDQKRWNKEILEVKKYLGI